MSATRDVITVEHRGCRFSCEVRGSGPPVVLVQGVGVAGSGWKPQVDELADGYRCLTFDNRGMGASQPPGAPITVAQMAEDALHLMTHLGWESAHVVGHSLGGPVALEMALAHPARVRSLALLCTCARGRDATRLSPELVWLGIRSRVGSRRMRRRAFLRMVMPEQALTGADPDAIAARLAPLFGHDLADQPPIAMKQLSALRAFDARDRLARIAVPTLVLSATDDPIAPPRFGKALAEGIPGAWWVEVDASHGVTLHRPDLVNPYLEEHLARAAS